MVVSGFGEVAEQEITVGINAEIVIENDVFHIVFILEDMADIFSDLTVTDIFGEREMFCTFGEEFSFIESHKAVGCTADDNRFCFFVVSKDFIGKAPEAAFDF